MSKVRVKIKGLDAVLKNLKNAPNTIQEQGNRAIKKSILLIQASTIPLVPVDTSFLVNEKTVSFRHLAGALKFHAPYAGFVHDGTRYMRARPFLRQGFEKVQAQINNIWKELGENIVNILAKT